MSQGLIVSRSLSFMVSWYQELMDLRDASASKNLTTHMPNCQDNVTFVATKRKREKANREKCIQYQQMAVTSLCLITPKIYDPVQVAASFLARKASFVWMPCPWKQLLKS